VNFDVPHLPEDYIHRVGRTARADATGEAFTLVSPEEEGDLRAIEKAIGKKLPRRTLPGFDYHHKPVERFEVPIAERIAAIRARKAEERARAKEKAARREANAKAEAERSSRKASPASRPGSRPAAGGPSSASGSTSGASAGGGMGTGGGGSRRRRRGGRGRGGGGGSRPASSA
jgi:ATP-dependent RNA helicase RhlE